MRFRRQPHVAWRTIEDETIVIDLRRGRMYGLNATAGSVWTRLAGATDGTDEPVAHHVDGARQPRLHTFVKVLLELDLVTRVEGDDGGAPALELGGSSADLDDAPAILREEALEQAGQRPSCAFLPAQNPLCQQVPIS